MKAMRLAQFGSPENLRLEEAPDPELREGHVAIRVKATGINPADLVRMSGKYPQPLPLPYIPGTDVAGEVEALGAVQDAGNWVDITRQDVPAGNLYSWWSYRAADWDAADKGRRLDHIWATSDIAQAGHSSHIVRDARGCEKPSDHAPVFARCDH